MKTTSQRVSASELRTIAKIAREELGLATLETRGSDRLDFHDLGVGSLRDALQAAYRAGLAAAAKKQARIDTYIDIAVES